MGKKGIIFDIKRFAVEDGPGIRTTVFFKGCPLRCKWCHNPESWTSGPELSFAVEKCIGCGRCKEVCPNKAILLTDGKAETAADKCNFCGRCAEVCSAGAKKIIGRCVSAEEIVNQVEKDLVFYEQSGGGVTFSGGEPLMQADFLDELLEECTKRRIHTAIDTSCYSKNGELETIAKADLFLCDLKIMDGEAHKNLTGVDNAMILENIKRLSQWGKKIIIRIPVIAGFNDTEKNIEATGKFAANLSGLIRIDLLAYHWGGLVKSQRLNGSRKMTRFESPGDDKIMDCAEKLRKFGLDVRIGG
jgi:pyruvate formate lyase activating enzyme